MLKSKADIPEQPGVKTYRVTALIHNNITGVLEYKIV